VSLHLLISLVLIFFVSSLPCSHLTSILGLVRDEDQQRWLVLEEFCSFSSLNDFLCDESRHADLSIEVRLKMSLDLAKALEFLHSQGITHGNLTPDCIFVSHDYSIRLGGFGWTKYLAQFSGLNGVGRSSSTPTSSFIWIAPEVLLGGSASPSADVFALGMLMFWILTLKLPYTATPEISSSGIVSTPAAMLHAPVVLYTRILFNNLRPDIPAMFTEDVAKLLTELWDADPSVRPPSQDIIRRLQ
jgi:serine/threonine protein kinase